METGISPGTDPVYQTGNSTAHMTLCEYEQTQRCIHALRADPPIRGQETEVNSISDALKQ